MDGLGGLGADGEPVSDALMVDVEDRRVDDGVVLAEDFDEATIALDVAVLDDDAVVGPAAAPVSGEANFEHV